MEGAAPSAPVSGTPIPEPGPVNSAPDPAYVNPALTEQRPPLNPEAEPPDAPPWLAVSEPVPPPSTTEQPDNLTTRPFLHPEQPPHMPRNRQGGGQAGGFHADEINEIRQAIGGFVADDEIHDA